MDSELNDDPEYNPSNESCSDSCDDDSCDDDTKGEEKNEQVKDPPNKSNTSSEINKSVERPEAGIFDDKDLYLSNSSSCSR